MKLKKMALFLLLFLAFLFIGIHLYFFAKHKGNFVIIVGIESTLKESMDISVWFDKQIIIECIAPENSYFIIASKSKFINPGKHTITVESKKRALKTEYNINVYFFKSIYISYYPSLLPDYEKNMIETWMIELWRERFEISEDWKPIYIE